jgi:outer membrane protein TolC
MLLRTFVTGLLLSAGAFAQMASFPKPSYFREVFKQTNTKVELRDPVRLKDFAVGGKLELSLKNFIELVMANNTDIQVAFLSLEIPKNNIVSVFGRWDPIVTASFSAQRNTNIPTDPTQAQNAGEISKSLSQPLSVSYAQTIDTGLSYSVSFSGTKSSSSNSLSSYNPGLSSSLQFSATQPLLQNRGRYVNRIPVMQAESIYKRSVYGLQVSLLNLVSTAENDYWNVISARENLRVQEKSRDAAKANLDFVQQQLDLGAIAELDIYNPQGQLAAAEFSVSQAKFRLASAEDTLRRQISADLDPEIAKLPVELTEPVDLAAGQPVPLDTAQSVQKALAANPNVLSAMQQLDLDELGIQSAQNLLLPQLSFTATYTTKGQGGVFYPSSTTLFGSSGGGGAIEPIPGGVSDALGQMFGFGYPTYLGRLTLTLPIKSRTASMNMANSLVTKKTDALTLRTTQQNVRLQTLTSVVNLQGYVEQLKLARVQRDIQQKNYEAEQEKYTLGTDTNQNVVIALQNLVLAESNVVNAQVSVRTGILAVYQSTGELLDNYGIVVR